MPFSFRNLLQNQDNTCVSASSAAAVKNEYVLCKNRTQIRPRNESPTGEERICLRPVLFLLQGMNGIAGGLPLPGTAGNARMLPNAGTRRTLVHAVYRLCGNACAAEAQTSESENAVWRYGRNTARRQARSSSYAAMVRAWLRQRRNSPPFDPIAGGINGHTQPSRCSRVQRPCPPPRRSKLRIVRFRAGTKAHSLRCSSSSNHNRFAGLRFEIDEGDLSLARFRTDPAISLWRQE